MVIKQNKKLDLYGQKFQPLNLVFDPSHLTLT